MTPSSNRYLLIPGMELGTRDLALWLQGRHLLTCQGEPREKSVASFPGRSHLKYLIAYSMQIRRGKAWEIWSCAVMSGRQKVDTRGAVPVEESRSPSLYYRSEGWRPEC